MCGLTVHQQRVTVHATYQLSVRRGCLKSDRRFSFVRTVEAADGPRVAFQFIREQMRDMASMPRVERHSLRLIPPVPIVWSVESRLSCYPGLAGSRLKS